MSLTTRLSLAFALVALLPTVVLGWVTLRGVQQTFDAMARARLDEAEAAARTTLEARLQSLSERVDALASGSPALRRSARELSLGRADLPSLVPLGETLLEGSDLDVLFLLDAEGRILSSGHLPGRFGEPAPELLEIAATEGPRVHLREIEIRREGRIVRIFSAVAGAPVRPFASAPPTLFVIAGVDLGPPLAQALSEASGASIDLFTGAGVRIGRSTRPALATPTPWLTHWFPTPPPASEPSPGRARAERRCVPTSSSMRPPSSWPARASSLESWWQPWPGCWCRSSSDASSPPASPGPSWSWSTPPACWPRETTIAPPA